MFVRSSMGTGYDMIRLKVSIEKGDFLLLRSIRSLRLPKNHDGDTVANQKESENGMYVANMCTGTA